MPGSKPSSQPSATETVAEMGRVSSEEEGQKGHPPCPMGLLSILPVTLAHLAHSGFHS